MCFLVWSRGTNSSVPRAILPLKYVQYTRTFYWAADKSSAVLHHNKTEASCMVSWRCRQKDLLQANMVLSKWTGGN